MSIEPDKLSDISKAFSTKLGIESARVTDVKRTIGADGVSANQGKPMPRSDEQREQCAFIIMARNYLRNTGNIIYANVNQSYGGGKKNAVRGAWFKKEGRLAGVPDIFMPWARLGYHGLYIEFKAKSGKLSAAQKPIVEALRVCGYCVAVCRSAEDAMAVLRRYTLDNDADNVLKDRNWK